jgi:hypothetical protein
MLSERQRERDRENERGGGEKGLCVIHLKEMRVGCRGLFLYEHALQQRVSLGAGKRNSYLMEVMVV